MTTRATESVDDIVERGEEIYQRRIRAKVEPENRGKFVALDVRTGEYEIDPFHLAALDRLKTRLPDAVPYVVRIGAPVRLGLGVGAK